MCRGIVDRSSLLRERAFVIFWVGSFYELAAESFIIFLLLVQWQVTLGGQILSKCRCRRKVPNR